MVLPFGLESKMNSTNICPNNIQQQVANYNVKLAARNGTAKSGSVGCDCSGSRTCVALCNPKLQWSPTEALISRFRMALWRGVLGV